MTVIVLTGPPAAGKNTVATSLAARIERLAVVDVDAVRQMVVQPHRAPWDGEDGRGQQLLGVRNGSLLTREFAQSGFHVLILDVLTTLTAERYRGQLDAVIVRLLLTRAETDARSRNRNERLTQPERHMLYDQQEAFMGADLTIDNSQLTADTVAERLVALMVT